MELGGIFFKFSEMCRSAKVYLRVRPCVHLLLMDLPERLPAMHEDRG